VAVAKKPDRTPAPTPNPGPLELVIPENAYAALQLSFLSPCGKRPAARVPSLPLKDADLI
jgi:hypothetical protein